MKKIDELVRLQKALAEMGIGSRREIENWIQTGRIEVDDQVATLGVKVSTKSKIKLDGQPIIYQNKQPAKALIYHKPIGEVCTRRDEKGRKTIYSNLPEFPGQKWISVGRLDLNTSGLILLTTDGKLANALMHPSAELEREYAVRVLGDVSLTTLQTLQQGVALEDGMAKFESIQKRPGRGSNQWFHVTVKEGRNRLVRRLWESQNCRVNRLIRLRYGHMTLPKSLQPGQYQAVPVKHLKKMLDNAG